MMVLSLGAQAIEECGSYWLSVAAAIGIPTLLGLASFCYIRAHLIYSDENGGKIEYRTLFGEFFQADLDPNSLVEMPSGISGSMWVSSESKGNYATSGDIAWGGGGRGVSYVETNETGFGCLTFICWYPILNFCWSLNAKNALEAGLQLTRYALKKPVLAEESVGISKMVLVFCSFAFAIVGLVRKPDEVPDAVKAFFAAGTVPDIRVFLLASTISSVFGFTLGVFGGLTSKAPSAREAAKAIRAITSVLWGLMSLGCFAFGCWQINERRKMHLSVLGMFIYWAPMTALMRVTIAGINVFGVLGIVGVVLAIVTGNTLSCRGHTG